MPPHLVSLVLAEDACVAILNVVPPGGHAGKLAPVYRPEDLLGTNRSKPGNAVCWMGEERRPQLQKVMLLILHAQLPRSNEPKCGVCLGRYVQHRAEVNVFLVSFDLGGKQLLAHELIDRLKEKVFERNA